MAKIFRIADLSTPELKKRKADLLCKAHAPEDLVRASCVKQYLTCGKPNCRCQRGKKHGPFEYLVQCLHTGKTRKFLLKSDDQKSRALHAVSSYTKFQECLEELSQINTELLRRGEKLRHEA